MNPWPFILAAYALTFVAVAALGLWSWRAMSRAEKQAEAARRK